MNIRSIALISMMAAASAVAIEWRAEHRATPASRAALVSEGNSGSLAVSGPTMGSTWTVRVVHLPPSITAEMIRATAQETLDRIEQQMSTYRADSELSKFNRFGTTDWFPISEDFAQVADLSRHVSDETGGAFDVTVGPLVNLWGFGPVHPAGSFGTVPPDAMIEEARKHVNYHLLDVRLNPPALRKSDPLAYVDLSAIAKGFAAEQVGHRLAALGISDYLVLVGGEVRARGSSHLGHPWRVGIETPTPGVHRVLYTIELHDLSLSTSGDYRNYFDVNGHRYCHEIDPGTGRPSTRNPASVTVANASGGYADAMATALMVLGPNEGMVLASKLHLAAFFIIRDKDHFETRTTPEFQQLLDRSNPATMPMMEKAP
jgi:thiamine biosynthesis lipoprotein